MRGKATTDAGSTHSSIDIRRLIYALVKPKHIYTSIHASRRDNDGTHYVSYDMPGSWIEVHRSTRFYLAPQKYHILCWKHGILGSINVHLSGFSTWLTFHADHLKKEVWEWFQNETLVLPFPVDLWDNHVFPFL